MHALMSDARNTSAPMIAEGLNVSAATVRNRIERLEEEGVIRGYTAIVDFEQADGRLTSVFMCTVPADERERLALAARSIPGVINVRVLMAGRRDLQVVVAVGEGDQRSPGDRPGGALGPRHPHRGRGAAPDRTAHTVFAISVRRRRAPRGHRYCHPRRRDRRDRGLRDRRGTDRRTHTDSGPRRRNPLCKTRS